MKKNKGNPKNDLAKILGQDYVILDEYQGVLDQEIGRVTNFWELVARVAVDDIPFFENDVYRKAKMALQGNHSFYVYGKAGCSKSYPIRMAAQDLSRPFFRMNMNGHATDEKFLGQNRIGPNKDRQPEMYWNIGTLEKAARTGLSDEGRLVGPAAVLLLDEISYAPPETLGVINPVMEPAKTFVIDEDGGRKVKAHPEFLVCAADNTVGTGDVFGGYEGTNAINNALRDRFDFYFAVDYDYAIERQILEAVLGKESTGERIKNMQKIVKDIRKAADEGAINFAMSIRRLIAWARGIQLFGNVGEAFLYAISNMVDPDQQNTVNELFQRVYGSMPNAGGAIV